LSRVNRDAKSDGDKACPHPYAGGVAARATSGTTPEFRAWLIEMRKAAGLTQEELAEAIQVGRRDVGRWETGGTAPTGPTLLRLLEATGHRVQPHPAGPPGAVNAALQELRAEISELRGERESAAPRAATADHDVAAAEHAEVARRQSPRRSNRKRRRVPEPPS
jgi:transcriptional regulator with XRE-family HTH domain